MSVSVQAAAHQEVQGATACSSLLLSGDKAEAISAIEAFIGELMRLDMKLPVLKTLQVSVIIANLQILKVLVPSPQTQQHSGAVTKFWVGGSCMHLKHNWTESKQATLHQDALVQY